MICSAEFVYKVMIQIFWNKRLKGTNCDDELIHLYMQWKIQLVAEELVSIPDVYVSCTKCEIRAVVATHSTSVSLLPRCTRAPTERHSSPVEVVLTGSRVALPGLVEIPKSPCGRRHY